MRKDFKIESYIAGINNVLGFELYDPNFSWIYSLKEVVNTYEMILAGLRPTPITIDEDGTEYEEPIGWVFIYPMFYADDEVEARTYYRKETK